MSSPVPEPARSQRRRPFLPALSLLVILLLPGCARHPAVQGPALRSRVTKHVSFAVLEDYDKGQDLREVALDFDLLEELGVKQMRCSLGWDDYEPARGGTDFTWLERFFDLAQRRGIRLRPYVAYTPAWAGKPGKDEQDWNNPPADYGAWEEFVRKLSAVLRKHPNVLSCEVYNEENSSDWWDGDSGEYAETLRRAARVIRAEDPRAQVLLGGMVYPDPWWLREIAEEGAAGSFDVIPFHAYPETWTPDSVTVENYLGPSFRNLFLPVCDSLCKGCPIWINEAGFATTNGRSERDQANWWARAMATFLAEPRIEHIGIYEIKDLKPESEAIGGKENYHLGLTRVDRTRKLAFFAVDLLTDLLDTGTLTVADSEVVVTVRSGQPRNLHAHLFLRPDGKEVLFVWDHGPQPAADPMVFSTVDVTVPGPVSRVFLYSLDGKMKRFESFSGGTLRGIELPPGEVRILRIDP